MAKDFYSSLNAYYGKIHRELVNKYSSKARQDEKKAEELESFFNYLTYRTQESKLAFNSLLKKEVADAIIARNPSIGFLLRARASGNSNLQGARGEYGFAQLIQETVKQFATQGQDIPSVPKMITGKDTVTVLKIPEAIANELTPIIANKTQQSGQLDEMQSIGYSVFQQKTDIRSIGLNYRLSPKAQWLLELSATVKNYQSNTVSMGKTSNLKIIRAVINASSSLNSKEKGMLLYQLSNLSRLNIYTKNKKHSDYFMEHWKHLQGIYEIIGIGQGNFNENNIWVGAETPNYLMVNLNSERIIIRSTRQLVEEILNNGKISITSSGTRLTF